MGYVRDLFERFGKIFPRDESSLKHQFAKTDEFSILFGDNHFQVCRRNLPPVPQNLSNLFFRHCSGLSFALPFEEIIGWPFGPGADPASHTNK
jgi:hypothetical protein